MFRILALCAFLAAASAVSAQTPVALDDAMATPESYFDHDIVFHDVFAGDLFRMNIEAFGGATFFLRIEDDARNFVGGFADVFVPILPDPLARQWTALGLRAVDFRRANVYGRLYEDAPWIILEIGRIELLDTDGTVAEVIE